MRLPSERQVPFATSAFERSDRALADIRQRGDHWMAAFVAAHSVLALVLASAHGTWNVALLLIAVAGGGFALCASCWPGRFVTRVAAGLALQAFCALHIYQMRGLAEMHFFYFTATTAMIIYQDWRAMWPGVLAIIAQHLLFSAWHNLGVHAGGHPFFEDSYVSVLKLMFHFGIALFQVAIASYWAERLRRRTLEEAAAHDELMGQAQALAASEQRFRTVVESVDHGLLITDRDDRILYANARAEVITGYAADDLVGRIGVELLVPAEERDAFNARMANRLRGETDRYELPLVRRDGTRVWTENSAVPFRDDAGEVIGSIGVITDITARRALESELTRQAFEDALTGLANRARLSARMARVLSRPDARHRTAMLLVDLDDFKHINDSLGHAAGDQLLSLLAARLLDATRGSDTVARLGGDEFAVLLGAVRGDEEATIVAERVIRALQTPFALYGREVRVGASIGIAIADANDTADDLLRNADLALYRAKALGKGRHAQFSPDLYTAAVERLELEVELRRALDEGQFVLHYQPILELASRSIIGVEALVRWCHPERGMMAPDAFIPLAEATGLILPLGNWALAEACREAASWDAMRDEGSSPLSIAVNVSGRQLQHARFPDDVAAALHAFGLPASQLVLEVTESTLLDDIEAALRQLEALRALGVRIALDDFGTGYSSLAYLQRLPVDVLKIDRAFTSNIAAGGRGAAFARAVLTFASALGMRTVAEGVETRAQHEELRALGCGFGQGHHYSYPLSADDLRALLAAESTSRHVLREPDGWPPAEASHHGRLNKVLVDAG
ncbi:MAG: EAL domain-containing protein [Gemmatimonadota bacterium]